MEVKGDLEGWEEVAVYIEPVVVFSNEARSFVELALLRVGAAGFFFVGGDEFDDASVASGLGMFDL